MGESTSLSWKSGQPQNSGVSRVAGIVTAKLRLAVETARRVWN
ncbi:MAG TPA: hypothetical protein VI636_02535 [Candidatus Angelobacter sp.]